MPALHLETFITADPEVVFDLSIDVDAHQASVASTGERAVAGVTSGRMTLGDTVTWEAVHLGFRWHVTSRITAYDRPRSFTDEMVDGPFRRFVHDHEFRKVEGGTLMVDVFDYTSPLGLLGRLADRIFLRAYMRRLLETRNAYLKETAEASVR